MNRDAAYGIAAHFAYKEGAAPSKGKKLPQHLDWVQQVSGLQHQTDESTEYLEHLQMDFFKDRVFVFTPRGDVIDLPIEASPIDFAYAIHSDIGDHVSGALVNGKFVALDTPLKNGDIVEIITKKNSKPTGRWLEYARTAFAKKHIRSYIQREETQKRKSA
jgi:GTP pyrophosphokinase